MELPDYTQQRYFISYTGVKLPLRFVNEISEAETDNRNTFFCGYYDEEGKMVACDKQVYGEVEFSHRYDYYPSGQIRSARIAMLGDEPQTIEFPDG
jgi:hypothetical protein